MGISHKAEKKVNVSPVRSLFGNNIGAIKLLLNGFCLSIMMWFYCKAYIQA